MTPPQNRFILDYIHIRLAPGMREPGRRRTDVLGGVLNEQTADHPFVVSSVPAAGCRRRRGTTGESGARRPGTGFYVSLAVMLSGLVALGVLVYFAFFRFPPIPRTDAMASASVTCRHIGGITDDRKGITFEVSSTEGLSAVGRLESLAQENNGGPECYCVPWELEISYQLKNGKTSTRTYSGHAADEDIRAVLEAIPDAADAIAAAADTRP